MQSQEPPPPFTAAAQPHRSQRRPRIPLSCEPCRARKLKCNREVPCQNCSARDEEAACRFRGHTTAAVPPARHDATRRRIDDLENLVKALVAERRNGSVPETLPLANKSPADGTVDSNRVAAPGRTVIDRAHSVYLGGDDWHAVLQEIGELRTTWNNEQSLQAAYDLHSTVPHTVDGSSLLFNQAKPIDRMEILSSLPPKPKADRLISHFFDRQNFPIPVPPILHQPTFMREYEEHWKDPSRTELIWLGLLFSIFGITMLAYHQHGEPLDYEGTSEAFFQLYRMRTAQCIQSGDISKCLPYTVETLRFNATAELNRKDDNRRGLWLMTGIVLRAAINMGYHRDPSQTEGVSIQQAEYRRRIWLSVVTMDDMASFLGGFPRMMSSTYSDTMEPLNLHDWELSRDMAVLPPSRPLTEPTAVTYLIAKGRLFEALGRVSDFNSAPTPRSYDTVREIDSALDGAYQNFPPHMKVVPGANVSSHTESTASFSNLSLWSMYHKGMCILHRRFLGKNRADGPFRLSRDRCISSAMSLLAMQQRLEPSLYRFRQTREMLSLAAIILLLELELRRKARSQENAPDSLVLLQALENSCSLWEQVVGTCEDAERVHKLLDGMLASFRIGTGGVATSSEAGAPKAPFSFSAFSTQLDARETQLPMENDVSSTDFDWGAWDAFIEEDSYETGPMY